MLDIAPVGIFPVEDKLQPLRERGEGHLDEVAGVINGFGERGGKDD